MAPSSMGRVHRPLDLRFDAQSGQHTTGFAAGLQEGEMARESCRHPNRVRGVVALDFSRVEAPDHPVYSGVVSVGVCEECGHVELYAQSHRTLCDWLREKS